MRAVAYIPVVAALAQAGPLVARQSIDFDLLDSVPDPSIVTVTAGAPATVISYDLAAATASATAAPIADAPSKRVNEGVELQARSACGPQPLGQGVVPDGDTVDAFLAYKGFADAATGAAVPSGYVQTYENLKASSSAYGYMGYTALDSYDVALCASKCDAIQGCSGINVFFERDPSLEPASSCPDPASTTTIKCVFWGGYVAEENANNDGQWRNDFHVVIAGSNGYMKTAVPDVAGYQGILLGDQTIEAPYNCNGEETYMGVKLFTISYFDPALCAAACTAATQFNLEHPPPAGQPVECTFFATYIAARNGRPEGQYCALYSQGWDKSFATNTVRPSFCFIHVPFFFFFFFLELSSLTYYPLLQGQSQGNDKVTVGHAYAYWNVENPGFPAKKSS
jgi:hypothetical protein